MLISLASCQKKAIPIMIEAPVMSKPMPPTDTLGYFRKFSIEGVQMFCASEDTFFVLTTDLERYIKETESCPSFKGGTK